MWNYSSVHHVTKMNKGVEWNVHWAFYFLPQDIHKELEEKISRFHEREDAILYACCFDANAGVFEVLLGPDDAVLSDELNHASIIDGIRLCKAKKFKYKNKDMAGSWQEWLEKCYCACLYKVVCGIISVYVKSRPRKGNTQLTQSVKRSSKNTNFKTI